MAAQEVGGPAEVRTPVPEEETSGVAVVMVMLDAVPSATTPLTIPIQVAEGLEVAVQSSQAMPEPEVAPLAAVSELTATSGSKIDNPEEAATGTAVELTAATAATAALAIDATDVATKASTPKSAPKSPLISQSGVIDEPQHVPPERASSASRGLTAPASAPSDSRQLSKAQHEPEIMEDASAADGQPPETTAGSAPANAAATSNEELDLKGLATAAAINAGQAYVSASVEARSTIRDLLSLREKEGPPVTLSVDQIATALVIALAGIQLIIIPIFAPSTFRLIYSVLCGLLFGLALSFMFYYNLQKKTERNELLGTSLGLKGVQLVAAGIPPMFNISETEKMEWLNRLVEEVWPFFDKGVCEIIKETTAQVMPGILATLPGGLGNLVKSIGFKHLTFGAAPIRVESIWVSPDDKGSLVMEVSVKWCGDPNITLAIEVPGGQKLCPRVMDISFVASIRLVLGPLVPRLPGFVAAVATMPKTPLIKYRLDFGKAMGGSLAPAAVTPVINYFLRDIVDRMLVWPARLVVPILQETPQDMVDVSRLMRRHRGVLRVTVTRGKDLKDLGALDKACVTLTTDSEHYESTSGKAFLTLPEGAPRPPNIKELMATPPGPVDWNETLYLLIQEPDNQNLRLEAFDTTAFASRVVTVSGRRLIGRAQVKLAKVCKAGAEGNQDMLAVRVQLGSNDWGSPGGPGKGNGKMLLRMTYFPCEIFTKEQVLASKKGIVTVRFLLMRGLTPLGTNVTFYASVNTTACRRDGKPSWRSSRKTWSLEAHNNALAAKAKQLESQAERDQQEGRAEEAAKKLAQAGLLRKEVNAEGGASPLVTLDYLMDTWSMHAFYDVHDTVEETGEENEVIIKVVREGRGIKAGNEVVGVAHVPISSLRNACSLNPLSGNMEHGLIAHINGTVVRAGSLTGPLEDDTGIPLDGCSTARLHMVIRYVPCLEVNPDELPADDDEVEGANRQTVSMLPSTPKISALLPSPSKGSALLPSPPKTPGAQQPSPAKSIGPQQPSPSQALGTEPLPPKTPATKPSTHRISEVQPATPDA